MSLADGRTYHQAKSASAQRPNWLIQPDDVVHALEAMDVGFGLYDRLGQLVGWNSLYLEHFAALVLGGRPDTPWQKIAGELGLCSDDAEKEPPSVDPDDTVLLHASDGRSFQVSRREAASGGFVVTSVEIAHLRPGSSPYATRLPPDPTTSGERRPSGLTDRAREVLRLLVRGHSMKHVARELGITARTVAFHKYRLMEANGLRTNADLLHFAIQHGLLDPVS